MGSQQAAVRPDLHFMRASGLAQARLQLAVLSGNRRRALEQIDRLVAIDKDLERVASGQLPVEALDEDLGEHRLALASEKLVLTSQVQLPRMEPAFGAGFAPAIAYDEPVEIVEDETFRTRLLTTLVWCFGFVVLCLGVTAAALMQL
jgi:hypothetical protein